MVSGALLTSMAVGFGSNDLPDPVTLIGKIVLNVVAVVALVLLARNPAPGPLDYGMTTGHS